MKPIVKGAVIEKKVRALKHISYMLFISSFAISLSLTLSKRNATRDNATTGFNRQIIYEQMFC